MKILSFLIKFFFYVMVFDYGISSFMKFMKVVLLAFK